MVGAAPYPRSVAVSLARARCTRPCTPLERPPPPPQQQRPPVGPTDLLSTAATRTACGVWPTCGAATVSLNIYILLYLTRPLRAIIYTYLQWVSIFSFQLCIIRSAICELSPRWVFFKKSSLPTSFIPMWLTPFSTILFTDKKKISRFFYLVVVYNIRTS